MRPDPEPQSLAELCESRARTHADLPAVGDGVLTLSYASLAERARGAARLLTDRGVAAGDRVVVIGRNSTPWVVAAFGCFLAGAALVPVGHGASRAERSRLLGSLAPRLVITDEGDCPEAREHGVAVVSFHDVADAVLQPGPCPPVDPAADALVLSSSGTTGPVKHVTMTHRQLMRLYGDTARILRLTPHDRLLGAVPLAHSFGFNGVLLVALIAGAFVRLMPTYDRALLRPVVEEERLTVLAGPPTVYHDLAASPLTGRWTPRLAVTGSTEVSARDVRDLCDRLGIPEIVVGYGMTETCGTVALGSVPPAPESDSPVMTPVPGVDVRICDDEGGSLPSGVDGRILVRGYNVSIGGRLDREGDGWFDTGDIGRLDHRGRLCVMGRRGDAVIVSGFNVHPREVEVALATHPAVDCVAVVGVPDPRQGERLVAWVVSSKPGLTPEDLLAHGRNLLAAYKVPRRYHLVDELPRTSTGKVSRARLRAMVTDQADGV